MNALMTIQVRVLSAQALAQLKALEAAQMRAARGTVAMNSAARLGIPFLAAYGSRIQWLGRQLMYNFAIPIMLAMGLATKFALDNEKAMVRVTKVYGDGSKQFNQLSKTELPALGRAFESLSAQFGVNQAAVIDIAGDWAAAGASGLALAKVVKLTLETMVLGELEATEATRDLIAIQAQYGMNTKQLTKTIDILNMVENQTGATMQDLITGMAKASGVAKTAGIDVEHLSAMMSALVPATGSAASAGNGLKTIISRLLSPTTDAIAVMKEMGVQVDETAWNSLNGTQRLEEMAKSYENLSSAQKVHVATLIASRYQINRFSVLMDAVNNQNSYYNKTLKATSDRQAIYAQRVKELNQVLSSNPQKLKQVWTIMQNAMANVITPLLPMIAYLAQQLAKLFQWFQNLDPAVQKMVLGFGLFIVALAFITKLLGATMVLLGVFAAGIHGLFAGIVAVASGIVSALIAVLTSPWTIALAAIAALVYFFHDQILDVFRSLWNSLGSDTQDTLSGIGKYFVDLVQLIVDAWWALPEGVRNAMISVLTVIRDAALQIYEWMSYLNPWAHHSPSLVESVTSGMDEITRQYGRARGLGAVFAAAAADLAKFKNMMPKGGEFADERTDVAKSVPKSLALFDKLVAHINRLTAIMKVQERAVAAQQAVVDRWKKALDQANEVLDRQSDKLDKLQKRLSDLQSAYDAAQSKMQNFANAPIHGMQAMSDAIFDNEMAQKRLQLQMMQWEQVNGSIDSLRDRLGLLQGDIETLTGRAESLRQQGAGSDVLGPITDQIAALEAQAAATNQAIQDSPVNEMQKQLEELQKQGQMLQLQYDINYDPLTRQISQLANAQKELSYDEIVAGIKEQQAVMAQLQPQIDQQTAAVATQQAVVDRLTESRDALQSVYDAENKKLERLNDQYQKTKDLISDIGGALRDMASAATQAGSALEASGAGAGGPGGAAVDTFRNGAGANFPEVGGTAAIGREGGLEDQSALIDQFSQQTLDEMNSLMDGIDMLGPIKKKWNQAWGWVEANLGPIGSKLATGFTAVWNAVSGTFDKFIHSDFAAKMVDFGEGFWNVMKKIGNGASKLWDLVGPDIMKIIDVIQEKLIKAWKEISPELAKLGPVVKNLGKAWDGFWQLIKPFVYAIGVVLVVALKLVSSVLANVLGPVLDHIIDVFKNVIKIVVGVIEVFVGLLSGDWKMAWQGFLDIITGALGLAIGIFTSFFTAAWGIFKGLFYAIVDLVKWFYDILVGHSIIPDLIDAILGYFKLLFVIAGWIWDKVIKPVYDHFVAAWPLIKGEIGDWWGRIKATWSALTTIGQWIWDNVLVKAYNKFVDAWTWIKGEVESWWGKIKTAWDGLKNAADWIKTHVMDPITEAFKTGWNTIKTWFSDNASTILSPIKSVVRGIITAINWIIKGLNKLDALPGVSISISEVTLPDEFAAGGVPRRRVGNGFMTQGARAIVGEGKANYPEFVIPTDPTHRNRAWGLLQMAASKIGKPTTRGQWGEAGNPNVAQIVKDNPANGMYDIGGFLGDVAGAVGNQMLDLGEGAINLGQDAFGKIMDPMLDLARKAAGSIDWSTGKDAAVGAIDLTEAWLKGATEAFQKELATAIANSKRGKLQKGLDFARSQAGKPYKMVNNAVGGPGHDYYDCSGFMSAVTRAILGQNPHDPRIGSTQNFPWSMYGAVTMAAKDAMSIGSTSNYGGSGTGHMAGTLLGVNIESNGDQGVVIGGRGAFTDSNFGTHAQLMMREGGIIQSRYGGTQVTAGEAGRDEAFIPLPRSWRTDAVGGSDRGGDTTINIYGNLEFPNIKSGGDAKTFIDNLEDLAG